MKKEIQEFVSNSIKQIKDALPNGFILDSKLDFDISVTTKSDMNGKIDIKLAGLGTNAQTSQTHRLRFSIIDEKAQEKVAKQGLAMINNFFTHLAELSQKYEQDELLEDKSNGKTRL
jgi:hypothetical protein